VSLKVDYCSHKAAKYACEKWHYSECMPAVKNIKYGVWENSQFIGSVIYSRSVNNSIGSFVGLTQTETAELTRVALDEHESPVSQIVSYTMKMIAKKDSGLKLLVSYADPAQGHNGGIYQAMNWHYVGDTAPNSVLVDPEGNTVHQRTVNRAKRKGFSTKESYEQLERKTVPGKHKYAYSLDESIERKVEKMSKPYP
jgi:hypothetical protein